MKSSMVSDIEVEKVCMCSIVSRSDGQRDRAGRNHYESLSQAISTLQATNLQRRDSDQAVSHRFVSSGKICFAQTSVCESRIDMFRAAATIHA